MIRVIQRRLIIPRGDTGVFTIPAMTQAEGAIGVFTIFDPITNTRIFQKQVEIEGENFNISFSHADTVNLKAGEYLWDIKFYKNPILADNKVIDGEEINSYYAAFQAPKCEIRETGDDFLMIEGQPAKIEDLNIILVATEAANAAKVAATEQAGIAATKAEEAAAKLEEMMEAMPTKVSDLIDDSGHYTKPASGIPASDLEETYLTEHQDLSNYVQKTDYATASTGGIIKVANNSGGGVEMYHNYLRISGAIHEHIISGTSFFRPIVPAIQHESTFYGLAKAAGDTTQSQSSNTVGAYTDEAKAAIQRMLDVPSTADIPTNVSELTNDEGYLTEHQDISGKANSADLAAVATSGSYEDLSDKPTIPEVPVQDVQVNGVSVLQNGVANVPLGTSSTFGVVRGDTSLGVVIQSGGRLSIFAATDSTIKNSTNTFHPIVPAHQHASTFYGLAKAAGDTTQSASSNAVGVYTDSAKAAIKNMLGITQTLTVTVLTQDNVTVTGQTVTIRAVDATGPIFATAAYEGQPVAFAMPSGFTYHISVSDTLAHHFNPTTASGVINNTDVSVTLQYSDFSTIRTATDIKAALNAGLDLTDLVGEQITCTKNGETLAWDVADYDATNGRITLLLHDAFGTSNMVFEPAQALMWCENGLAAGSYTFTWNTTQCYFTLTTAIPAGGQLRATNSQFQTYASQEATATLETGTVGTDEITGATDLGHDGQGLLNHRDRVNYGSNNFAESALFGWLNSDAAANTPRVPVTKFSRAYSYSQPGFINGLDANFVNCLDEVDWLCSTNNVYECPESLGGYTKGIKQAYTVKAKFGLASEMEIFGSYGGNPDGSTVFDLYNGAEADDRKKYRGTSAQVWWLRSPHWFGATVERSVTSSGGAYYYYASNSYAVVPACRISRDTEVNE